MKFLLKKLSNKAKGYSLLTTLALGGGVLLYLPPTYFDRGQAMCLSVLLANVECYACGMTRAIQHLIHLEIKEAYEFNPLAFFVFPLAVGLILWEAYRFIKQDKKSFEDRNKRA